MLWRDASGPLTVALTAGLLLVIRDIVRTIRDLPWGAHPTVGVPHEPQPPTKNVRTP